MVYNVTMKNIEIKNLKKTFGCVEALSGLNFDFKAGEKYSLIGPKGSGGSTLLNIIAGLEDYSGSVKLGDKERSEVSNHDANISYVLEKPLFFERKTVLKNLEYQYKTCGKSYDENEVVRLIESWNLDPFEKVKKLSYVEKLLLSLVRIEIKNSDIVLIDLGENLENFNLQSDVFSEMFSWIENYSGTVIVAENGVNFASKLKSKMMFLNFGVLKGEIDIKNEIENPSNFFTYFSALKASRIDENPIEIKIEKTMYGLSVVSSGATNYDMSFLKNVLNKRTDFKIGDKLEVLKLGGYFFEKLGGKIIQ